jgi:hypothetical protein
MSGTLEPIDRYLPVLSVVLVDARDGRESVLVGIRSDAVNRNHPNVVSVPTMRLPLPLAEAVLTARGNDGALPKSICTPGVAHDPVGYALWSVLAAKVGLADAIERKAFDLSIVDSCVLQGESLIDYVDGVDVVEQLTMINLLCLIERGHDEIPPKTAVFSRLSWLDYGLLVDAATSKDLSRLSSDYQAPEICIHGLCIQTAVSLFPAWRKVRPMTPMVTWDESG